MMPPTIRTPGALATPLRHKPRRRPCAVAAAAALAALIPLSGMAAPVTWAQLGGGNWTTASNWSPAAVPVADDEVTISNGGTAWLGSGGATPLFSLLRVGVDTSGTGVGTVTGTGTDLRAESMEVGVAGTGSGSGNGTIDSKGAVIGGWSTLSVGASSVGAETSQTLSATGTIKAGSVSGFSFYRIGVLRSASGSDSTASGVVITPGTGASTPASGLDVGVLSSTGDRTRATGVLDLGKTSFSQSFSTESINIGVSVSAGGGSFADGTVKVDGRGGAFRQIWVGAIGGTSAAQALASGARGQFRVGGDVDVAYGGAWVGSATGFRHDGDAYDQANGDAEIGGTLRLAHIDSLGIGLAQGGEATGSLRAGRLELTATGDGPWFSIGHAWGGGKTTGSLEVGAIAADPGSRIAQLVVGGLSGGDARADGKLRIGHGDLQVARDVWIGAGTGVSARGEATLGGVLAGSGNSILNVGFAEAAAGTTMDADVSGTLAVAGIRDFRSYRVGTLLGVSAADARAVGTVSASGTDASTVADSISVGVLSRTGPRAQATGMLDLSHSSLRFDGYDDGVAWIGYADSGRGSFAEGTVNVGGDAGRMRSLVVGHVYGSTQEHAGSSARGEFRVGGNLDLDVTRGEPRIFIGSTGEGGADRDGSFFDQANGSVQVSGRLRTQDSVQFAIGTTLGGEATGSLQASRIEITPYGADRWSSIWIGTSGSGGKASGILQAGSFEMAADAKLDQLVVGASNNGTARGELRIDGGNLRIGQLFVGETGSGGAGSAQGSVQLRATQLTADDVRAGVGIGASASIGLMQSQAQVNGDFRLDNGELLLDDSLLQILDTLTLGSGATLQIDIDGLLRGTQYGAIDADLVSLAGTLAIDLGDFDFFGDSFAFDLVVSGGSDGITGDFTSVLIQGLAAGYEAHYGIEHDSTEVYRLRLTREAATVAEPGTLALLLGCLVVSAGVRRRTKA